MSGYEGGTVPIAHFAEYLFNENSVCQVAEEVQNVSGGGKNPTEARSGKKPGRKKISTLIRAEHHSPRPSPRREERIGN